MDKRNQCVDEALRLFVRQGFRGVTIGELTQRLNVSSKTIYQLFGDKDHLVREAVALYHARSQAIFDQLWASTSDPAELLVRFHQEQVDKLIRFSPLFFREVVAYLPEGQDLQSFFGCTRTRELLTRGQREGLFQPQMQAAVAAEVLTLLLEQVCTGERFATQGSVALMQQVLWPYMRGLCTEKGLAAFRHYRQGDYPSDPH